MSAPQTPRVARFVVVGPFDDSDRHLLGVVEDARAKHGNVELDLFGRERLTAELRLLPDVVRTHLGDAWRDHLCGVGSGTSLCRHGPLLPPVDGWVALTQGHVEGRPEEAEL